MVQENDVPCRVHRFCLRELPSNIYVCTCRVHRCPEPLHTPKHQPTCQHRCCHCLSRCRGSLPFIHVSSITLVGEVAPHKVHWLYLAAYRDLLNRSTQTDIPSTLARSRPFQRLQQAWMLSCMLKDTHIQLAISTIVWLGRDVCQIEGSHMIESRGLSATLGILGQPLGPL